MSSTSHATRPTFRSLIDRFGFRHLLGTTLVLVSATILLGIAAKATGSGLACEANWPQCDAGPFNLFPASLPSFYEWIHRFVAMFAGFAIIGSALAAVRLPDVDRRVAALVVLGMLLTPVQVVLGRETVLQYQMQILSLHFWTAVLIFVVFVVATTLVWESRLTTRYVAGGLGLSAVALPLHVALSPLVLSDITNYSPTMQMAQYGVTLALLAGAIVAALVGRERFAARRTVGLLFGTTALAFVVVALGRRTVMTLNPALDYLYVAAAVALLGTIVVAIRLSRTAAGRARPSASS